MKLYSGSPDYNRKMEAVLHHYDMGVCISSIIAKSFSAFDCFLDNGAYPAYIKGRELDIAVFWKSVLKTVKLGIKLDFVVAPDIITGGLRSLELSTQWFDGLRPVAPVALAVQDGMKTEHLKNIQNYDVLFIGGTPDWKLLNIKKFCDYAHAHHKKCHVGRIGTLKNLLYCHYVGVDSVDSSSWIRNKSFHIIDSYYSIINRSLK